MHLQVEVTLAVAKVLVNSSRRNFHSRVRLPIVHSCWKQTWCCYMCSHATHLPSRDSHGGVANRNTSFKKGVAGCSIVSFRARLQADKKEEDDLVIYNYPVAFTGKVSSCCW